MGKTGTKANRGGWLKNPIKPRDGEVIGGGFFVFRRGDSTNRVRPSMWPFEHPSEDQALAEAARLASEFPGYRFDVVAVHASCVTAATDPAQVGLTGSYAVEAA